MDSSLPDLVRDTRLEIRPFAHHSVQIVHVSNPALGQRRRRVEQVWEAAGYLGRGSFGEVQLEKCTSGPDSGQLRAVKKLWKRTNRDAVFHSADNYHRELEAIAKFSQERYRDCFVRSFGWYETDDSVYITMEYCPLGDLQKHLHRRALPEAEACVITHQILEGIQFMHDNHFAHRDLKPGNVLVLQQGPQWWVKIADFGISKRVESTALRTVKGTEAYLAPEVLGFTASSLEDDDDDDDDDEERTFTLAVDIWSLGVIAFQMVTGNLPFPNPPRQLRAYAERGKESVLVLGEPMTSHCKDFMRKTLAACPEKRVSANQALGHPWLEGQALPTIVSPQSPSQPIATPVPASPPSLPDASALWTTLNTVLPIRNSSASRSNPSRSQGAAAPNAAPGIRIPPQAQEEATWPVETANTTLKPSAHRTKDSAASRSRVREIVTSLQGPMAKITIIIDTKIEMAQRSIQEIQSRGTRSLCEDLRQKLHVQTTQMTPKELDKPRMVCTNPNCVSYKPQNSSSDRLIVTYKLPCHGECFCIDDIAVDQLASPKLMNCVAFQGSETCRKCHHNWRQHMHVLYDLEEKVITVKDPAVEELLKKYTSQLKREEVDNAKARKLVAEYGQEREQIQKTISAWSAFLQRESAERIHESVSKLFGDGQSRGLWRMSERLSGLREKGVLPDVPVRDLRGEWSIDPQGIPVDEDGVKAVMQRLYGLEHFGKSLAAATRTMVPM